MFPSTTSSTPLLFQDFLSKFHSRRLLLDTPLHHSSPDTAASPSMVIGRGSPEFYPGENSFDANIVMVLSVLLCAIICALGLNSVIRCALRCSSQVTSESGHNIANRLSNTGVKKKTLNTFSILAYSSELKLPGLDTMCAICLSEFSPGEGVRVLPNCNHGFHIGCIDKWLMSHTSCPTCRHCLIKTCKKKIASCSQASSSEPTPPLQGGIGPLEPEGLIRDYRSIC